MPIKHQLTVRVSCLFETLIILCPIVGFHDTCLGKRFYGNVSWRVDPLVGDSLTRY